MTCSISVEFSCPMCLVKSACFVYSLILLDCHLLCCANSLKFVGDFSFLPCSVFGLFYLAFGLPFSQLFLFQINIAELAEPSHSKLDSHERSINASGTL